MIQQQQNESIGKDLEPELAQKLTKEQKKQLKTLKEETEKAFQDDQK